MKRLYREAFSNPVYGAWLLTSVWFMAYVIVWRKPLLYALPWLFLFWWVGWQLITIYAFKQERNLKLFPMGLFAIVVLLVFIGFALWNPPCQGSFWLCW